MSTRKTQPKQLYISSYIPGFQAGMPCAKPRPLQMDAAGTTFAYLELGLRESIPWVLLNLCGTTAPCTVDGLARKHPVVATDYFAPIPSSCIALPFRMPGITSGLNPASSKSFIQRSGVISG